MGKKEEFKKLNSKNHFSNQCTGVVLSSYSGTFFSSGRFETRKGLRIIKSGSCHICMGSESLLGYIVDCIGDYEDLADITKGKISIGGSFKAWADCDGDLGFIKTHQFGKSV